MRRKLDIGIGKYNISSNKQTAIAASISLLFTLPTFFDISIKTGKNTRYR